MKPGIYNATITEHGTDRSGSGLPFVWFDVEVNEAGQHEFGRCKVFLAGGDEQKTQTALRMGRQALKVCGFDPDTQDVNDLDIDNHILRGNIIPVRVKETPDGKGGFWTNWDILLPRALSKNEASSLTAALRGAKSKDEPEVAKPSAPAPAAKPNLGAPIAGVDEDSIPF